MIFSQAIAEMMLLRAEEAMTASAAAMEVITLKEILEKIKFQETEIP